MYVGNRSIDATLFKYYTLYTLQTKKLTVICREVLNYAAFSSVWEKLQKNLGGFARVYN